MKKIIDVEGLEFCSVNKKMEIHKKKRIPMSSEKYKFFRRTIGFLSKSGYKGEMIDPPYKVLIKTRSMLDIDNPIKPILDGLQDAKILKNDAYIKDLHIIHERGKGTFLKVWVGNIPDPEIKVKDKCNLSDYELIEKCRSLIFQLCKYGGKDWTMSVPVDFNNDSDMILMEIVDRFQNMTK